MELRISGKHKPWKFLICQLEIELFLCTFSFKLEKFVSLMHCLYLPLLLQVRASVIICTLLTYLGLLHPKSIFQQPGSDNIQTSYIKSRIGVLVCLYLPWPTCVSLHYWPTFDHFDSHHSDVFMLQNSNGFSFDDSAKCSLSKHHA